MHRLFLQFLTVYPELKEKAKNVLTQFIGDPSARHIDVSFKDTVCLLQYLLKYMYNYHYINSCMCTYMSIHVRAHAARTCIDMYLHVLHVYTC